MNIATDGRENARTGSFRVRSSLADDVWHGDASAGAYEWWYFDAASPDGRDVLVIIFMSNFVFSPSYNQIIANGEHAPGASLRRGAGGESHDHAPFFPALAVCLYRDNRPLLRAINEYTSGEFAARMNHPACAIGRSRFQLHPETSPPHYLVEIDTAMRGKRRLQARLKWELEESDLLSIDAPSKEHSNHDWNMVAPRCRVAGSLTVQERHGEQIMEQWFDGIGYHDHNRDTRPLPDTISNWQWGRAHFTDATAIFYRYRELQQSAPVTKLLIVRDHRLAVHTASYTGQRPRRHHFGLGYPQEMQFAGAEADGRIALRVRQRHVIDGSFFYLRFTGAATLDLNDGPAREAVLISEHLAPRALQWPALWWFINMRIGRRGRGAFLP